MSDLVVRQSWVVRLLQRVGLLSVQEHNAGSDFGVDTAVQPGYNALQAMSAYAAFPWVKAVVNAKATDLSGLPIKLIFGTGPDAEVIPEHEVLDLIAQPSERVTGLLYRRQQWVDLDLTGNAYGLMLGEREPTSVLRLHPYRVRIQAMSDGQVDYYEYDQRGSSTRYDWSVMLHTRGPSWEDDPTGLFGTGLIRALHNDLSADLAASQTSAKAASKGRPDALISPKDSTQPWTKAQVDLIKGSVDRKLMDAEGGALIMGGAADYKPLTWSPKDMEFQSLRQHVREAVLAASGVPPSRVSLPTANYAQAKEMERTYWQALQGEAALLDAEWTRLARRWDPRFRIVHDFSSVPALQEDRSARVQRVQQWWTMGLSLSDAAAFEGFDDLPEPEHAIRPPSPDSSNESASGSTKQTPFRVWWRRAPLDSPRGEEARAAHWRRFIDRVHGPVERGLNLQMRAFLQEQARRYGERLEAVLGRSASGPPGVTRAKYDDIDFSPPKGCREEAARGVQWVEEGHAGDGLKPETIRWARRFARGEDITPDKARKMRAWLARHEVDKTGEGFKPGEDGFPSPGRVAWALWCGDAGKAWSTKLVRQMDAEDAKSKGIDQESAVILRDLSDEAWRAILDEVAEAEALGDAVAPYLRQALQQAFAAAMAELGLDIDAGDDVIRNAEATLKADLITRVSETTKEVVSEIVRAGLATGATIQEMQESIASSRGFAPSRALTIARTETTRAVNRGAVDSYRRAVEDIPELQMQWLSARDDSVRPAHAALDGDVSEVDGTFVDEHGHRAAYPGGFNVAADDINCRCTVIPYFAEEAS